MSVTSEQATPTRFERRRERTRAALVAAAQRLIAEGRTNVAVSDVTEIADVGTGTFYNHFTSKEELFEAAAHAAMERLGDVLALLNHDVDDPAEVFARAFRIVGRLHRVEPELSLVVLRASGPAPADDTGLVAHMRHDLERGRDAGRFDFDDLDVAATLVVGATVSLGFLLHEQPERDAESAVDETARHLLQSLGLGADDARAVATAPLEPALDTVSEQARTT